MTAGAAGEVGLVEDGEVVPPYRGRLPRGFPDAAEFNAFGHTPTPDYRARGKVCGTPYGVGNGDRFGYQVHWGCFVLGCVITTSPSCDRLYQWASRCSNGLNHSGVCTRSIEPQQPFHRT